MTDAFEVRALAPQDFDRWLPLWDGYNSFYGRSGPTALQQEITQTTWARFFDTAEPMHALVAEAGDKLVGLAHYLFHRSTTSIAATCYLQDLFTSEQARGRGVATALIKEVYSRAKKSGASRVYWQTHESNETAQRLYEKLSQRSGFIVFGQSL